MRTAIRDVLIFKWNGSAAPFLGYGWSAMEPNHTWAVGPESTLTMDSPDAPHGFFIEFDGGPWTTLAGHNGQYIHIAVNGRPIGSGFITQGGPNAFFCPPLPRSERKTIITFQWPDAARPRDVVGFPDDRQLAFAFVHLRILALLEPHPVFQRRLPERATDHDWRSVTDDLNKFLSQFEMISGNCGMGLMQRHFGVEPLSLLRFAGAGPQIAINGLDTNFEDFGINLTIQPGGDQGQEWMVRDAAGLFSHSGRSTKQISADEILAAEKKKLGF